MKKSCILFIILAVITLTSSVRAAAAFDPAVLHDTYWYVSAKVNSTWAETDGAGSDSVNDLIFLALNSDNTFAFSEIQDDSGTELFDGTWTCDSKGKLTLTADPDSLIEWFKRDLDGDEIIDESSFSAQAALSGKVIQKGNLLKLKLTGVKEITATYQAPKWVYDSQTQQWSQQWLNVNGLSKDKIAITGLYDLNSGNLQDRTYYFDNLTWLEKIGRHKVMDQLSCYLTIEPDNTFFGQFTLTFPDGSYGGILTGYYVTSGKKLIMHLGELVSEDMVKEQAMDYLNSQLQYYVLTLDTHDQDWEVDCEVNKFMLSENTKKNTAKLICKLNYDVYTWVEGELEDYGQTSTAGNGSLVQ